MIHPRRELDAAADDQRAVAAIAELHAGHRALGVADQAPVALAHEHAGHGTHPLLDLAGAAAEALVRLAVAVVVDAVADLDARLDDGAATHDAAHGITREGPWRLAGTHTHDAAFAHVELLVGLAVAVVVDGVAALRGGLAGNADAAHGARGIAVELGRPRAGADPHAADVPDAEAVVGRAIAVIVQAVAGLGAARAGRRVADRLAVLVADPRARSFAHTQAGGARLAEVEVLVRVAVTVVVDAITDLDVRRAGLGGAGHPAGGIAGERPDRTTGPLAERADRAHGEVLVDVAIAVVVRVVADLDAGLPGDRVAGHVSAVRRAQGLAAAHTGAHAVCAGVAHGIILVDVAVAVVVQTVAGLRGHLAIAPDLALAELDPDAVLGAAPTRLAVHAVGHDHDGATLAVAAAAAGLRLTAAAAGLRLTARAAAAARAALADVATGEALAATAAGLRLTAAAAGLRLTAAAARAATPAGADVAARERLAALAALATGLSLTAAAAATGLRLTARAAGAAAGLRLAAAATGLGLAARAAGAAAGAAAGLRLPATAARGRVDAGVASRECVQCVVTPDGEQGRRQPPGLQGL